MSKTSSEEHVLPRPVEKLPEYAHAKSRRALAERLRAAFGFSEQAANATADAVVEPSTVRKNIGEPQDPQVEELPVPGGKILGIRVSLWARRIMPDPRNPRIGPSRRHPFAVDPGSGSEDSRFRPVPEPRVPEGRSNGTPELIVEIESRHQLEWASAQAAKYVLAENDWRTSIAAQGVMEAVWVVPTTYRHADGSALVTVLTTVEGSSRTTAVHDLLSVRSADVPYEDYDQRLRVHYRKLNEAFGRGATSDQLVALRCERIPALIVIGFRGNPSEATNFPTAVKSLVALRHVDPPKPWGEGPENESLADQVLFELHQRNLITTTERAYFAGYFTKAEAKAAHLSDDPAHRTSRIVRLFTTTDERVNEAIRVAVTSQSTRKRITSNLRNELATALIMRSLDEEPAKTDQVRRYMRNAFGKAVHGKEWASTERDTEVLAKEAAAELVRSADGTMLEPGAASLELAVRAAYPLVTTGSLNADRGTRNNDQPDRRTPGEVLDAMRRTPQGVHQLAQGLLDFKAGLSIRMVDESGAIRKRADGLGDQIVSDVDLRNEFPPPGKVRARSAGDTPTELLKNCLADFSDALGHLGEKFTAIGAVVGHDGTPLVEVDGADTQQCEEWRKMLSRIGDELNFWGRTFRRRHKVSIAAIDAEDESSPDGFEPEVEDLYDSSYEGWDAADRGANERTEAGRL